MAVEYNHVKGLRELHAALQSLPIKLEKNVMRSALRAGANVIRNEARATAAFADQTGKLRKSIRVSTRATRGGVVQAKVSAGGKRAFYAHFVEFGTAAHHIFAFPGRFLAFGGGVYKVVSHPGTAARPFMRPALDSKRAAAVQAFGEKVRSVLSTKHGINVPAPFLEGDE